LSATFNKGRHSHSFPHSLLPLELAQMKKHFLELAAEYPLWDGAASFAKNPIALLSVIFGIALMFTLIVVYGRR